MRRLKELWRATCTLSQILRTSDEIQYYANILKSKELAESCTPLRRELENHFTTFNEPSRHALYLVESLRRQAMVSPITQEVLMKISTSPHGAKFIEMGIKISESSLLVLEWLRSRLPGYPFSNLPRLHPWSNYASSESWFFGTLPWLPWSQEMRALGLNRRYDPPDIGPRIAVPPANRAALTQALLSICLIMRDTGPWLGFEEASNYLTDRDREDLKAAYLEYRKRVHPHRVEQEAGNNSYRRYSYRADMLSDIEERLNSRVRKLIEMFEEVEQLFFVFFFLLSTLVVDGLIERWWDYSDLEVWPQRVSVTPSRVVFTVKSAYLKRDLRRVLFLANEILSLSGLMLVVGQETSLGESDVKIKYSCLHLGDSCDSLPDRLFVNGGL